MCFLFIESDFCDVIDGTDTSPGWWRKPSPVVSVVESSGRLKKTSQWLHFHFGRKLNTGIFEGSCPVLLFVQDNSCQPIYQDITLFLLYPGVPTLKLGKKENKESRKSRFLFALQPSVTKLYSEGQSGHVWSIQTSGRSNLWINRV